MSATEYLFYHTEQKPVAQVLPQLLEKTLERGWRALVRASSAEFLDAIDSALWTYREDSFLPHGTGRDGFAEYQPIFLALGLDEDAGAAADISAGANPNGAEVLFLLETASGTDGTAFKRVVRLFDDANEAAKAKARAEWKALKERGFSGTYWRQDLTGKWVRSA